MDSMDSRQNPLTFPNDPRELSLPSRPTTRLSGRPPHAGAVLLDNVVKNFRYLAGQPGPLIGKSN